jgi:ADP-ribose pyrophosphatase YjhB (NUDIX family)
MAFFILLKRHKYPPLAFIVLYLRTCFLYYIFGATVMVEASRFDCVTLNTNLSPFPIARYPKHKFLLEGHICSLRVEFLIIKKYAPVCSMLLKRSTRASYFGCWELPGGKVNDQDRSLREAAERKIKEITGMTELNLFDTILTKTWDTVHRWLSFTLLATVEGEFGCIESMGSVEEENRDLKWVTKDDALRMDKAAFYGTELETILGAFNTLEEVVGLSQHGSSSS